MSNPIRARRVLVEIAQPIGGIPDYAERPLRTTDPKRPAPMATKNGRENNLILAAALAFAALLAVLTIIGH